MGLTMPLKTGCVCSIVMYDHIFTLYTAYVYYECDIEKMMW